MSALVERIIAARDRLKGFSIPSDDDFMMAREAMADAANVIVGQEALLKAESAARLDLSLLAAEEAARADLMRGLLTQARWYVIDALEAHEHSDGRELLREIDRAVTSQPQSGDAQVIEGEGSRESHNPSPSDPTQKAG